MRGGAAEGAGGESVRMDSRAGAETDGERSETKVNEGGGKKNAVLSALIRAAAPAREQTESSLAGSTELYGM